MRYRVLVVALALLVTLPAAAEVYRCDIDGVVAFSDRPCGPDARRHSGGAGISFVTPDENLSALAEAARTFIRARRARLARRTRPAVPSSPRPGISPRPALQTVYLPWPVHGPAGPHRPGGDGPGTPPEPADRDRYSPLDGPILGTRRDIWLFNDAPPGPERGSRR